MLKYLMLLLAGLLIFAIAFFLGIQYRKRDAEKDRASAENEAKRIMNDALKEAESKRKEALVEAKDEIYKIKADADREVKERRAEVSRQERRLQHKEETLDKKIDGLDKKEEQLQEKIRQVDERLAEADAVKKSHFEMLEKISGFTTEQAKDYLLASLDDELTHEKALRIAQMETRLKEEADQKARNIVSLAIQRCAADQVAEMTVSVVPLPNDDMKGRIIGREGRNIRMSCSRTLSPAVLGVTRPSRSSAAVR